MRYKIIGIRSFQAVARELSTCIKNPITLPEFMTLGKTYLLPKDDDTGNPAKYRPITCLPTLYKIFTGCIANKIYSISRYTAY